MTLCGLLTDCEERIRRPAERRHHYRWLPVEPALHDGSRTLDRLGVAYRSAAKLDDDHVESRPPVLARSSAFSTEPPAAPRTVLCPRATIRRSRIASRRTRPTVTVIPLPAFTSRFGCGRSTASLTTSGCFGLVGSPAVDASPSQDFIVSIAASGVGLSSKPIVMQMVWPCSTGTRLVWALTLKPALVISPSSKVPSSFSISRSSFGSSSAMYGITLPRMSSEGTPG